MKNFNEVAAEIGTVVTEKNAAYGSSFSKAGDFLKLLYPDGIKPEQYGHMLLLVRIFDKQMRIATDKDALGESPFRDIAGYGILGASLDEVNGEDNAAVICVSEDFLSQVNSVLTNAKAAIANDSVNSLARSVALDGILSLRAQIDELLIDFDPKKWEKALR